jgi:hypothetical protein
MIWGGAIAFPNKVILILQASLQIRQNMDMITVMFTIQLSEKHTRPRTHTQNHFPILNSNSHLFEVKHESSSSN